MEHYSILSDLQMLLSENCKILWLWVLTQYQHVMDGWTDRQTHHLQL